MAFNGAFSKDVPLSAAGLVRSPFGVLLPPGGKVAAYVYNGSASFRDQGHVRENLVTSLKQALGRVRSGYGDTIVCLPGHTENIDSADWGSDLVDGTRVVGVGSGSLIPALRWTATGATFLFDKAGLEFEGLRLRMEGANGVVAPITVSAADCAITNCDIEVASGATAKATTPLTLAAGADRFKFRFNRVRGTATHNVTNGIAISGTPSDVEITDNLMQFSATAANGLINVTGAALSLLIARNWLANTMTSSTSALTFGAAASTGIVAFNLFSTLTTGAHTPGTHGIVYGSTTLCRFFENYSANDPRANGLLMPAVDT